MTDSLAFRPAAVIEAPWVHFEFVDDMAHWRDLHLAVMGSLAQVNAVPRAGARIVAAAARTIVPVYPPPPAGDNHGGKLKASIRERMGSQREQLVEYDFRGQMRRQWRGRRLRSVAKVGINRRGDGDYSRTGTGVRYGTAVHQGATLNNGHVMPPRPFLYQAIDANTNEIDEAMQHQYDLMLNRFAARSKVLTGMYGAHHQRELRARIARGRIGRQRSGRMTSRIEAATDRVYPDIEGLAARTLSDVVRTEVTRLGIEPSPEF